ncbi:NUDIX domain-containing protein [archaeon]|nr:NUDIX domain-containing protein [archaeon]
MVVERPSVQAVIYDVETRKMLLIMIHDTSMDELVWRLVKGGIAEGEADPEAMRREIAEEVGLRDIRVLEKINYYEFQYMDLRHLVSVYLVEADIDEAVTLQSGSEEETAILDHAWLSPEEALETLYWEDEKRSVRAAMGYLKK